MILQQHIEKLFYDSDVSYYVKEKSGNYADVNQAFLHEYGDISHNDVIGQKDIDLWHGKAPLFHINDQRIILNKQSGVFIEDIIYENKKRFYMSCKSYTYSRTGKVTGIFGVSFPLITNQTLNSNHFSEKLIESIQLFQTSVNRTIPDPTINNIKLSNRQKECLHFLARGMTIKEIGMTLNLSPKTIENYLSLLKVKLQCFTRSQLVNKAFEFGLI